jgi:DNA-binding CsgD family transcriptional regulator
MALNTVDQSWWSLVQMALYTERQYYERARAILEKAAATPRHVVAAAHLALFEAIVARRERRRTEMKTRAKQAAMAFARIGWPYCQAMACEVAGRQREALALYLSIGDHRDHGRLESIVQSRRRGNRALLTLRESEVVRLVAAGKSNREVAGSLAISERTVEHHLESIFGKLGIRSRGQLIALGFRSNVTLPISSPTNQ